MNNVDLNKSLIYNNHYNYEKINIKSGSDAQ